MLLPWYTAQVKEAQQLRETAGSAHQQRQAERQLLAAQSAEQSLRQPECLLVFIGRMARCAHDVRCLYLQTCSRP
jgi:hypothetical protein